MRVEWNIDRVVERLEASLMPRLADFADELMKSHSNVLAETCSIRHAPVVHVLGLSCRPKGTQISDSTTVAFVLNVIAISQLSLKAYIVWQSPSFKTEASTSVYQNLTDRKIAKFERKALALLPAFVNAVERGKPV